MKKLSLLLLVIFWGSILGAAAQNILSLNAPKSEFRIIENTRGSLRISLNVAKINTRPVATSFGSFTEIELDGFSKIYNTGKPQLPALTKLIEIPLGAAVEVNVISYDEQIVSLPINGLVTKVMPCQPTVSKSAKAEEIPFYYDQVFYQQDAFNADPLASVEISGMMRGVQMGLLKIAPVRYNPVLNQLKVYNNIVVEIRFNHADYALTEQTKAKYYSPAFDAAFSNMINYSKPAAKDVITKYPIKYVIIGLTSFQSTMQPFVTWKRKKGFTVVEQYYASIPTAATVKAYLQGLYNAGTALDPAPSFVLFVGDVAQIPTNTGVASTAHKTDLYFCTLDASADYLPDMYFGRFSATSVAQLQPQIDKTLEYEQYLMPVTSYLDTVVMIAGVDDGTQPDGGFSQIHGNGQINYGTINYFNTAHGIYSNTYLWPASNNSASDVAIRSKCGIGVGYANYTAHGSSTGWADPSFQTSDIAAMHNNHKYGLMIGNCCQTNTFNDSECFGEALLRAANKGAVGYIGGSNYSYWDEDYYFGVGNRASIVENPVYDASNLGAYDKMFHDHGQAKTSWYYTNAQMIYAGNLAVEASSSTLKKYYWEIYHLMGDPSVMNYFSVPDPLSVAYTNPQSVGVTSLLVTTEEDAYVAISHNGVLLDAELAPVGGVVTLNFTAFSSPDTADIVITKQNKQPYIGTVRFVAPSVARDASVSNITAPAASYTCSGISVTPQVSLVNMGTNTLVSVTINYYTDAQAPATYLWTGSLATLASVDVSLPSFVLTAGAHTFTAYTSNPNGGSDQNTTNDSYTKNYEVNELVVTADFSADQTSFCSAPATINFTNSSANGQTYLWDFGDGNTSTDQHPVHAYSTLGTYSVELTTSAGVCGSVAETKLSYISVGAESPSTTGNSHCGPASLTITANGTGSIAWYDAASGGSLLGTGTNYTTPVLSSTTTYYAENQVISSTQNVGDTRYNSSGGLFTSAVVHGIIFDAYEPFTLVSVQINSGSAGTKTISLQRADGTVITSSNVTLGIGLDTVTLNWAVPADTGLKIVGPASPNMYRNSSGATYPYTIPGVVSLKRSTASTGLYTYYYYFYNWVVQPQNCTSGRIATVAEIFSAPGVASFGFTPSGLNVAFNNTSTNGSTYYWDFGDGTTSTLQSPSHTYAIGSLYNVMLITTNACNSDTAYQAVDLTLVSVNELQNDGYFNIYPNPANGAFTLDLGTNAAQKVEVSDLTGRIIASFEQVSGKVRVDLTSAGAGVYYCRVITEDKEYICKIANIK